MMPHFRTLVTGAALAFATLMLAACENPYLVQFKQEFGWTEARMLRDGWLEGRRIPARQVYCYETLADTDCFARPQRYAGGPPVTERQTPPPEPDF